MTFIEAIKIASEGGIFILLEDEKYKISQLGFIEEYVEGHWVPVILSVDDYLSEDWEVDYVVH